MNKPLIKNITFYVGMGLIFAAGIIYVLLADIVVNTQSLWIMLAMLLSFGSAICGVLAENFKERRTKMIVLKSVAVGLAVLFIAFLLMYMLISISPDPGIRDGAGSFEKSFAIKHVEIVAASGKFIKEGVFTLIVYIVSMALALFSVVALTWNLIMSIKYIDE